jgi:large subunit ribosomal protein L15
METKLHNLIASSRKSRKTRKGRGNASGKGTYCSRGLKGQRSRSGGRAGLKKRSLMRQLVKKIPKIGGFRSRKKK